MAGPPAHLLPRVTGQPEDKTVVVSEHPSLDRYIAEPLVEGNGPGVARERIDHDRGDRRVGKAGACAKRIISLPYPLLRSVSAPIQMSTARKSGSIVPQ